MSRNSWRGLSVLLAYAVVGWLYCGMLIVLGRRLFPMDEVLIVHAIGAPLGFALLTFDYYRKFAFTPPLTTAVAFVMVVIVLDFLVVAPMLERSFAMFRSFIGMWIPLTSIFGISWLIGAVTRPRHQSA